MPGDEAKRPIPRDDADAVIADDNSSRLTRAARALVLGNALASPSALIGISDDIGRLGFNELPGQWGGWETRIGAVSTSDQRLSQFGVLEDVRAREEAGGRRAPGVPTQAMQDALVPFWQRVASNATVPDSIAWLRLLMTGGDETASAAAAVALSYWRKRADIEVPRTLVAASEVVSRMAALPGEAGDIARAASPLTAPLPTGSAPRPSTGRVGAMVHGTNAWAGTWWYPGGDFHAYAKNHLCADMYSGGMAYSWDGKYKGRHRRIAAERLADWAQDASAGHLCCVYAHSYGGIIAMMATAHGLKIDTLVLLSVPCEGVPVEWRNIERAVSLRIHLDLVLLAARRRQRFTENVEEFWLDRWFVSHGDSHDPQTWDSEGCQQRLGL